MKKKSNLWAWYVHGLRKILLVMKICSCLLLCMMLSVSAMSYSQNKKLTMEKKSENLLSVLKELGQVSDYEFFYNDNEVNRYQVSFSVKDASVVDVLEEILKGIPLSYRMVDNVIVITPRELKEEAPKKIVITGIVKEKGGDILPGVTVLLKGTAIGTATDASGQFRLELPRPGFARVAFFLYRYEISGGECREANGIDSLHGAGRGGDGRGGLHGITRL